MSAVQWKVNVLALCAVASTCTADLSVSQLSCLLFENLVSKNNFTLTYFAGSVQGFFSTGLVRRRNLNAASCSHYDQVPVLGASSPDLKKGLLPERPLQILLVRNDTLMLLFR